MFSVFFFYFLEAEFLLSFFLVLVQVSSEDPPLAETCLTPESLSTETKSGFSCLDRNVSVGENLFVIRDFLMRLTKNLDSSHKFI